MADGMMEPLGRTLAIWREACGVSQKELAALLGVNQPTVSTWENREKTLRGPMERLLWLLIDQPCTLPILQKWHKEQIFDK